MTEPDLKLGWQVQILPDSKEILKDKSWNSPDYEEQTQHWVASARELSDAYQKYIFFVIDKGHITPSASSIFNAYVDENKDNLTIEEIQQALNDLWPTTDEESKQSILYHARRLGIKESSLKQSWQIQEPQSFEELVGYLIHYTSPFPRTQYANEYGVITSIQISDDPKYADKILLWGYWGDSEDSAIAYYTNRDTNRIALYDPSYWPVPIDDFDSIRVIKKVVNSSLKLSWQIPEPPFADNHWADYIGKEVVFIIFKNREDDSEGWDIYKAEVTERYTYITSPTHLGYESQYEKAKEFAYDYALRNNLAYHLSDHEYEYKRSQSLSSLKLGWQTFNIYEGRYIEGPTFGFVYIVYKDGKPFDYHPSLIIENHSPTGFAWGYGGAGPHQLALAILYDYTKDKDFAKKWQYEFMHDFVVTWPPNGDWRLSGDEIDNWIEEKTLQKESWLVRKTLSKEDMRNLLASVGLTPINFYIGKRTRRVDAGYQVNGKWEIIPEEMIEKLRNELSALTPEGKIEAPKYQGYKGKTIIVKVPVYRDTPNVPWREIRRQLSDIGYDRVDIKTSTTEIRVDVWGIDDLGRARRMEEVNKVLTILKQFNPNFKAYQSRLPGYYFYSAPIKMQKYPDEVTSSLETEAWAMTKNISKSELEEAITSAGLTPFRFYIGRAQRKAVACYRPSGRYENIPRSAITALRENLSQYEGTIIEFPITSPFFQYIAPRNLPERNKKFLAIFVPIKRDRQLLPVKEVKDAIRAKFPQYETRIFTRTNEIELYINTPWNLEGRDENLRGQAKAARYQELLSILKEFNTNTIISPSNNWRRNESGYHFLIPFSPYQEYVTGV